MAPPTGGDPKDPPALPKLKGDGGAKPGAFSTAQKEDVVAFDDMSDPDEIALVMLGIDRLENWSADASGVLESLDDLSQPPKKGKPWVLARISRYFKGLKDTRRKELIQKWLSRATKDIPPRIDSVATLHWLFRGLHNKTPDQQEELIDDMLADIVDLKEQLAKSGIDNEPLKPALLAWLRQRQEQERNTSIPKDTASVPDPGSSNTVGMTREQLAAAAAAADQDTPATASPRAGLPQPDIDTTGNTLEPVDSFDTTNDLEPRNPWRMIMDPQNPNINIGNQSVTVGTWPVAIGIIAGAVIMTGCGGLGSLVAGAFGLLSWPDGLALQLPWTWDDPVVAASTPASVVTPSADTVVVTTTEEDHRLKGCGPENHTLDGAYHFSRLPNPFSVIGEEKYEVYGLVGREECFTSDANNPLPTGAKVSGQNCLVTTAIGDVVDKDQVVKHVCFDRAGNAVERRDINSDLRQRLHDVPGHPGVKTRCVKGYTDHGCESKGSIASR